MKRESGSLWPMPAGAFALAAVNQQTSMKSIPSSSRLLRRLSLIISAAATLHSARAQTVPSDQLAPFITVATRTTAAPQTIGSAVETISAAELARRQITSLSQALGGVAGAPHFASGANGAISSLFLRGSNSNQTLFLVDGLRLNDPSTDYQVFLGGACVGACDSLEVAHGPQSTLYGGEAVGGVVSLRAQRGAGAPSARVASAGRAHGVFPRRAVTPTMIARTTPSTPPTSRSASTAS